ncbi:fatty acid binding protein 1-A, liver-like [Ptychodera flava]|uniref:fatty acid binding protein 1-A, liver-like n=1 Tax=Ptychodera flava TaxID=63121 RepID=UPI00396A4460
MSFGGKWAFVKSENVKEFMLAAGAPPERAENAASAQTSLECSKDGDYYVIKITGAKGNTVEQRFKPGEPFTESFAAIGKERQAVASIEGNKLTIKGVEPGQVVETREVSGDEMVFTLCKDGVGVIAKRYLKRV